MLADLAHRYRRWRALSAPADRPVVLMYHRVARVGHDPWDLAVAPDRFADQIERLARQRRIVELDWLAAELAAGRSPRNVAAITFDDGYLDVLENAVPVLERHGAPATFYLPTRLLGRPGEFWWDAIVRVILGAPELPAEFVLPFGTGPRRYATPERPTGPRTDLHLAVWRDLQLCEDAERRDIVAALEAQVPAARPAPPGDRPMTLAETERLVASPIATIGAHTLTHPSLPARPAADLEHEVVTSCRDAAEIAGRPVRGFAYPYGNYDARARAAVRKAGLAHAVTTEHGRALPGGDPNRLPRIQVGDWDGAAFSERLLGSAP
jgi:peptidoglycan/xylan/chitin deacetylase (PgdA/CDA1 family)